MFDLVGRGGGGGAYGEQAMAAMGPHTLKKLARWADDMADDASAHTTTTAFSPSFVHHHHTAKYTFKT